MQTWHRNVPPWVLETHLFFRSKTVPAWVFALLWVLAPSSVNDVLTCGCGRLGQIVECCYHTGPISSCCLSRCAGSAILVWSRVRQHVDAQRPWRWRSWPWTSLMSHIALPASRTSPSGDYINKLSSGMCSAADHGQEPVVRVFNLWSKTKNVQLT